MKKICQFAAVRYVLVARDGDMRRLAVVGTPRSLVDLRGLIKSLFILHPAVAFVEVVLPSWPADQTVDDQEVMISASRNTDSELPGLFFWHRVRDLRAIEKDIMARAAASADDLEMV